jgi:uncharacterized glyoxalase superfamily protein PhnB
VPDIEATLHFYTETLGFTSNGAYEEAGEKLWAEVARGEARIWFFTNRLDGFPNAAFSGLIYIFVDDVDALAARLDGRVSVEWGPETQPYGLREFGIKDLNGYYLVFAKDV